jgi:exodeoxyribonuclease-3
MTRIATFNVNGVNGRLPVLLKWLAETKCDIVCLQELKTADERFPAEAIREAGYGAIWHGQKSYNRVAVLARDEYPVELRRGLPGDPDDTHSRYIEAEVNGLIVGCSYLPNGNPAPGPKFDYKLRWFDRLVGYGQALLKAGVPTVLCGDFNVVPTPMDAVVPRRWLGDAVYFPESRQAYGKMLEDGWIDAVSQARSSRKGRLYLLEFLLSGWLRSELWTSDGPPACELIFVRSAPRCRGGYRGSRVGEAKRPCTSLDRALSLSARRTNMRNVPTLFRHPN